MNLQDCIFCKIVAKQIPAHIVHEDADFLAFLDIKPRSPGHVLVIPKDHYRWVWDVPQAGAYFELSKKIAEAQRKAFGTDMVLCRITGEEVPHAHIWVFPDSAVSGDKADLAGNAEKIRQCL